MNEGEPCVDNIQWGDSEGKTQTGLTQKLITTSQGDYWINEQGKKHKLGTGQYGILKGNNDCDELIIDNQISSDAIQKLSLADGADESVNYLLDFDCKKIVSGYVSAKGGLWEHYKEKIKGINDQILDKIRVNKVQIDTNNNNGVSQTKLEIKANKVTENENVNIKQEDINTHYETQIETNRLRVNSLQLRHLLWVLSLTLLIYMIYAGYNNSYIMFSIILVISVNVFILMGKSFKTFMTHFTKYFDNKMKKLTKVKQEAFEGKDKTFDYTGWEVEHEQLINDLSDNLKSFADGDKGKKSKIEQLYADLTTNYNKIATQLNYNNDEKNKQFATVDERVLTLQEKVRRELGQHSYFSKDNKSLVLEKRKEDKILIGRAGKIRTILIVSGVFVGSVLLSGLYHKFK